MADPGEFIDTSERDPHRVLQDMIISAASELGAVSLAEAVEMADGIRRRLQAYVEPMLDARITIPTYGLLVRRRGGDWTHHRFGGLVRDIGGDLMSVSTGMVTTHTDFGFRPVEVPTVCLQLANMTIGPDAVQRIPVDEVAKPHTGYHIY